MTRIAQVHNHVRLNPGITYREIASLIPDMGVYAVTRILRNLEKQGKIRSDRSGVTVDKYGNIHKGRKAYFDCGVDGYGQED